MRERMTREVGGKVQRRTKREEKGWNQFRREQMDAIKDEEGVINRKLEKNKQVTNMVAQSK